MEALVFQGENNQALTNSLLVAEKFGKRHGDVIRAIEEHVTALEATNAKVRWFCVSTYCDMKGEERKMYIMTRDGFSLLVMSFNNTRDVLSWKLQFIDAFNKMECIIKTGGFHVPTSFKEALLLAAKQQEQIEEQQKQLETQAPKVEYAENILNSTNTYTTAQIAKELEMSAQRLNFTLNSHGVIEKKGGIWMATESYAVKGYLTVKSYPYRGSSNRERTNFGTVWTEAGRMFIHSLIK